MSGDFSDFLELEILDNYFGALDYAAPATLYIGLSTADPTDDNSGLAEPSGNGYARVSVTNNKTSWTAASAGALANDIDFTFPEATGSWGTVTHFIIADAASAGNMLAHGDLTTSKAIGDGDTAKFKSGDLDISLD